jgi:hypothetical protein
MQAPGPDNFYDISVITSDISGAGTDANVFCILYGAKGAPPGEGGARGAAVCGFVTIQF